MTVILHLHFGLVCFNSMMAILHNTLTSLVCDNSMTDILHSTPDLVCFNSMMAVILLNTPAWSVSTVCWSNCMTHWPGLLQQSWRCILHSSNVCFNNMTIKLHRTILLSVFNMTDDHIIPHISWVCFNSMTSNHDTNRLMSRFYSKTVILSSLILVYCYMYTKHVSPKVLSIIFIK